MAVIEQLPSLYDEPFADSSQIPTLLVSRLARQHVTVSLSGDAGDELFCGYRRYLMAAGAWKQISRVPTPIRRLMAGGMKSIPPDAWNQLAALTNRALPAKMRLQNLGDKLHKAARVLDSPSTAMLYRGLTSHWSDPASVVLGGPEPPTLIWGDTPDMPGLSEVQRMMLLDVLTYLPDDVLTKIDRAAMGVSLETRVPFLDHRIVEFAWSLPQSLLLREGKSKWLLRQVLYRHVPETLIERPKMGFGVPLDAWLRGPLREWAEALLDERRLHQEGYFDAAPIRKKWNEHLTGQQNWSYDLWDILMFQSWLENQSQAMSSLDVLAHDGR
ncbi:Asparagine synthetase [glutamine-hydrolyzing] 1 [compost metagenome]